MSQFSKVPFFRIFLPFSAGILFALHFYPGGGLLEILSLSFLIALSISFIERQNSITKIIFLLLCDVFLFTYGNTLVNLNSVNERSEFYSNIIQTDQENQFLVTINELPSPREKTIRCLLKINAVKKGGEYIPAVGEIIAYIKKGGRSDSLSHGKDLLLNCQLVKTGAPQNPLEFDYQRSLELKQIYHICFVDSDAYTFTGTSNYINPIWNLGLNIKQFILSKIKNSDLSSTASAVCVALLTGYDDEIDRELLDAFAHSGTLHVLSVSGLHTGLFYLAFATIFGLIERNKKYPLLKFIFITLGLWTLALVTGFSPPVLRAVIMFNLFGIAKIFFRSDPRNSINLLFVSAFIILSFDPNLILDIGFQLSYSALLGIVYFNPKFEMFFTTDKKIVQLIKSSFITSLSATITTLPFTLFYFKQFPVWFLLSNLIVIPATFVLLALAVLLLFNVKFAAVLINGIISWLTDFISLFNKPFVGYIDNIDFNLKDAFLCTLLLFLLVHAFKNRSFNYAVCTLLLIALWQVNNIIETYIVKSKSSLTVYQIRKEAVSSVKSKKNVTIWPVSKQNYNYHIRNHVIAMNHPDLQFKNFNFVQTNNETYLFCNAQGFIPDKREAQPTVLVLSNNFRLTPELLQNLPENIKVVCDGTNSRRNRSETRKICSKLGLLCYDTTEEGAYTRTF